LLTKSSNRQDFRGQLRHIRQQPRVPRRTGYRFLKPGSFRRAAKTKGARFGAPFAF
jgi:hypothetical protein